MTGRVIAALIIFGLFAAMCFMGTGTDRKNMISFYSYPDPVQARVRENAELQKLIPAEKPMYISFLSNFFLFTVVFIIAGFILHIHSFLPALGYFLLVGEGLNVFDLLIIDMCWWRHSSRTKFACVPEKELYLDMHKHVGSFLRGIPVFAAAAIAASAVLMFI